MSRERGTGEEVIVTREEAERWQHSRVDQWEDIPRLARTVVELYDELSARDAALLESGQHLDNVTRRHDAQRACLLRLRDGKWEADVEHGQWITRASYDEYDDPCFEAEPMTEAEQAVMRSLA